MPDITAPGVEVIKPQVIIIEDEELFVRRYKEELSVFSKYIQPPEEFIEVDKLFDQLWDLISKPHPLRIFIVDIKLGEGRDEDGFEVMKFIRQHAPDSLIIVGTANADRRKCLDGGADFWFTKDSDLFTNINREISNYLTKHVGYDQSVITFYAEVAHIYEDGAVRLDCWYKNAWTEWEVEAEWVEDLRDLQVDSKLKITYTKLKKGFGYFFEEVDEIPGQDSGDRESNANSLYHSGIWSRKKEP